MHSLSQIWPIWSPQHRYLRRPSSKTRGSWALTSLTTSAIKLSSGMPETRPRKSSLLLMEPPKNLMGRYLRVGVKELKLRMRTLSLLERKHPSSRPSRIGGTKSSSSTKRRKKSSECLLQSTITYPSVASRTKNRGSCYWRRIMDQALSIRTTFFSLVPVAGMVASMGRSTHWSALRVLCSPGSSR
jgi:hypothetical protein